MKVLQINAVNGIRSTGRICQELADFLNSTGHEGHIAYSEGTPYEKGYRIGSVLEKKLHALNSRVFGRQAYYSIAGTKRLVQHIKKLGPDVVHLHNLHSNYVNLKLLLGWLSKNDIPTVLTLHDCWFFTGKCTHYTVDGCYKWKTGCGHCPRLRKDNKSWFFDQTARMWADKKEWFNRIPRLAVVGVSDWITHEAKESFLSSASIIKRIYNWIDLAVFKPTDTEELRNRLGVTGKFIILGVASVWNRSKGLERFVELSNKISEDMIIVLVGEIKGNIELPDNVIHINETHDAVELAQYYSLADVFVTPSLEETFGKTTAEALACGTPVVGMNSTAIPELIGEGCGYTIEEDKTGIYNAILKVYTKGKPSYTDNCIDFANNKFGKEDRINDYIDVYREISAEN